MRLTLRRSCDGCAKAKSRCDLQTPTCSRCMKRNVNCVFQNEPLTSTTSIPKNTKSLTKASIPVPTQSLLLESRVENRVVVPFPNTVGAGFPDPFDSYPQTSLPRIRVQGLIHHFLSKIAFQYYPLDLDPKSNPFVASWWPLALTDPALFNVSLQTASLDDELRAKKGFPHSDTLMADSVALVRQKIQKPSLAFQDATMDAVVTMAAIEVLRQFPFAQVLWLITRSLEKGNLKLVKCIFPVFFEWLRYEVDYRRSKEQVLSQQEWSLGILKIVSQFLTITTKLCCRVAMLVLGTPQFPTQDDFGFGYGVSTIPLWQDALFPTDQDNNYLSLQYLPLNSSIQNVLSRLRNVFDQFSNTNPRKLPEISTADLHDLTCFILHRLLPNNVSLDTDLSANNTSNCMRFAISIYMLIIHGPTYYSHAALLSSLVLQLKHHLETSLEIYNADDSLKIWLLSLGMVASKETIGDDWFTNEASILATALGIHSWEEILIRLKGILWLDTQRGGIFRQMWEEHNTALSERCGTI